MRNYNKTLQSSCLHVHSKWHWEMVGGEGKETILFYCSMADWSPKGCKDEFSRSPLHLLYPITKMPGPWYLYHGRATNHWGLERGNAERVKFIWTQLSCPFISVVSTGTSNWSFDRDFHSPASEETELWARDLKCKPVAFFKNHCVVTIPNVIIVDAVAIPSPSALPVSQYIVRVPPPKKKHWKPYIFISFRQV